MNREKNQFGVKLKQNRIYLWIFCLITLVFAVVWIGNHIYPLEDHTMILYDGIHQYIPFFSEYYEKIKNGESLKMLFKKQNYHVKMLVQVYLTILSTPPEWSILFKYQKKTKQKELSKDSSLFLFKIKLI